MISIDVHRWPFLHWKQESYSSETVGWMALVAMVLSCSTYNGFAKALTNALSPLSLRFLSEVLTGFFVLLSFGTIPTLRKLMQLPRAMLLPLVSIGLLSGFAAPLLHFGGIHLTTAVNSALFGNMESVFLTLLAVLVLRESFSRAHLASILTVLLGATVIALRGFSAGVSLQSGDLLVLFSCLAYSGGSVVYRKYLHHCDPHIAILARSITAIACFFLVSPFLPMTLGEEVVSFPIALLPVLFGFAFISRFLNGFTFYAAMERLPTTTVSMALMLPVIGSIAFSHFYLHEEIFLYHFVGGGLIIAGACLLEFMGIHPTEEHLEKHLRQAHPTRLA